MATMTRQRAWQTARTRLPRPESATLEAQLLLGHVLQIERTTLLAHGDDLLDEADQRRYEALIVRRADGEPYDYIVGEAHFYQQVFHVSPSVLIPRPETELLVEMAIQHARTLTGDLVVADIGTGSGAIAVTMADTLPQATVVATDISPAALMIARQNAQRHRVQVTFLAGDLAEPLIEQGIRVDVLLANLPYIAAAEVATLAVSRYEPTLALDGGEDGLMLIRRLLAQVPWTCKRGALILLEIGSGQGSAVLQAANRLALVEASVQRDYADHERIVRLRLA